MMNPALANVSSTRQCHAIPFPLQKPGTRMSVSGSSARDLTRDKNGADNFFFFFLSIFLESFSKKGAVETPWT
jgi:hypothetical protein